MITVSIEVKPAMGQKPVEVCHLEIINDETGDDAVGNYDVWVFREGEENPDSLRIENFDREQGAVALVQKALDKAMRQTLLY